jgi:hypothetical protein
MEQLVNFLEGFLQGHENKGLTSQEVKFLLEKIKSNKGRVKTETSYLRDGRHLLTDSSAPGYYHE